MEQFRNIGIIGRLGSSQVLDTVRRLKRFLLDRHLHVILEDTIAEVLPGHGLQTSSRKMLGEVCDMVIVVGGDALPVIECSVDEAIAGLCAEALGVMETALALTVDYARQREQFGKAIGQFQALQHRMVDMRTQIELSRSLTLMATLSLDAPRAERRKAVSAAKAYVSDALRIVGQGAVQIHGGIGTTDEIAISHYFRRATVMESQFGSAAHHLKLMAEVSG